MIKVNLSAVMGKRKLRITGLSRISGVSQTTIRDLWYERKKGIEFATLDALCRALDCQPGDLLAYIPDEEGRNNE